jgi:pyridinium-3,5-biscarboxylic acid mononucleotide sulfurtransferase
VTAVIVVGFDLDMTLIDSRPGVIATWAALSGEWGVPIDAALAASRLGPPLERELEHWLPAADIPRAADRFRALYAEIGVGRCLPMPGAFDAVRAARSDGGRAIVVTAKHEPNARRCLDHLGLEVDEVVGDLWGADKGGALRRAGASVYIGDHVGDVAGARAAGATSVAVTSGPCTADQLTAAGADLVIASLLELPGWLASQLLARRLADLEARLRALGPVLVAFSGGADSAFLLAAAVRALGPDAVVAATAVSPSLPAAELAAARAFAEDLGVRHLTPTTHEMDRDGYRANAADRCYFCKAELTEVLRPLAGDQSRVVTGTNADDLVAGFRPGIRAAAERGVAVPLADAGLTKAQVRAASRQWGLATWDKPAAACLSSRIAYGIGVTPARLARVERAEASLRDALRAAGFDVRDLRVRDLGDRARIEVDADLTARLAGDPGLPALLGAVEGFDAVELDPRGFRSGSMNEALSPDEVLSLPA